MSSYVEITAGGGPQEWASVEVHDDGSATVSAGTSAHGQGHATTFAMIVADKLAIPIERIKFVQSDTDLVPHGGGTGGSRSLQLGGSAVFQATDVVLERARQLAANLLEANPDDIVVGDDGKVGVAGVPASALSWAELASAAVADGGDPLKAALDFSQAGATFPFGAHVAVVEVDRDTGRVTPIRHIGVDDCGTVINPLLVAGQQHGGFASGIAQALYEHMVYDADGNPLTSTLAEYLLPSAAEFPSFEAASTETPSPLNPLGAKGIGEAGTIGATPAVQNAVIDAVAHLGIRHLDMPHTPERVWTAIQAAAAAPCPTRGASHRRSSPRSDRWRPPWPTPRSAKPTCSPCSATSASTSLTSGQPRPTTTSSCRSSGSSRSWFMTTSSRIDQPAANRGRSCSSTQPRSWATSAVIAPGCSTWRSRSAPGPPSATCTELGSEVVHPPRVFPEYPEPYFATFWLDPFGMMLEAVCHHDRD